MSFWKMLEQQVPNVVNAGLGLMLQGQADRRQLKQQRKLMELEMEGQRHMSTYNFDKQLEMWKATNYQAQVAEMKKANLNPALLYGMSGGGGVTTGTPSGNVTGAHAPQGGREVQDMLGLGIQMQLLQAQKENIQADTKKKNVEADKLSGVDTEVGKAQTKSLEEHTKLIAEQITTERGKQALQRLQISLQKLDLRLMEGTFEDRVKEVEYNVNQAMRKLQLLDNEQQLKAETYDAQVLAIRQEAANKTIMGWLMQTEGAKNLTEAQLNNFETRLKNLDLTFYADKFSLEKLKVQIDKELADMEIDPTWQAYKALLNSLGTIVGAGILKGAGVTVGGNRPMSPDVPVNRPHKQNR